jgi:hypothetical protein
MRCADLSAVLSRIALKHLRTCSPGIYQRSQSQLVRTPAGCWVWLRGNATPGEAKHEIDISEEGFKK